MWVQFFGVLSLYWTTESPHQILSKLLCQLKVKGECYF